jgi:hypothetical protein
MMTSAGQNEGREGSCGEGVAGDMLQADYRLDLLLFASTARAVGHYSQFLCTRTTKCKV